MSIRTFRASLVASALLAVAPLQAQGGNDSAEAPADAYKGTVFDGDYLSVGAGAFYNPSYEGSDDYVISPAPVIQGRLLGVGISPRPAGIALNFIPSRGSAGPSFQLGVAGKLNRNRVTQIKDPVVAEYGKLKTAIEVGPTVGVSFPHVLDAYDSLTVSADVLWDVNGASKGMTVSPSITYFTPVSKGAAISFSLNARSDDDKYSAYYFSVPVAPASVPLADRLPVYNAKGGFHRYGANLLGAVDFDGDLSNGGLAGFVVAGYSRLAGDAKDTPFTSIRGSATQWVVGAGLGLTF